MDYVLRQVERWQKLQSRWIKKGLDFHYQVKSVLLWLTLKVHVFQDMGLVCITSSNAPYPENSCDVCEIRIK